MILKDALACYFGTHKIKRIYYKGKMIFSFIITAPPVVNEENMVGAIDASTYEEGDTSWGVLELSAGCEVSEDGLEFQNSETFMSADITGISYPMTLEFKGRIDQASYKTQANNPGAIVGLGLTGNTWGSNVVFYATSDYGIIMDTTGALKITTGVQPEYCHLIMTIDDTGAVVVYINGIENKWTYAGDNVTRSQKTHISNEEGRGRFYGAVSVLRWWDTQLSTAEIEELFSKDTAEYKTL